MTVAELLEKPESWCQKTFARDSGGSPTEVYSLNACSWCIVGAIHKCYPSMNDRQKIYADIVLIIRRSLPSWNDDPKRSHEEILELVKKVNI